MNSRKNVKAGHKVGWKWIRLMKANHLGAGSSGVTNFEDVSANLHVEKMEESIQYAWMNLELSKAYADNLRRKLV